MINNNMCRCACACVCVGARACGRVIVIKNVIVIRTRRCQRLKP